MAEIGTRNGTIGGSDDSIGGTTARSWDGETTPVFAVVSAVADASGEDPLDLAPLTDAIDPEALNAVFTAGSGSTVNRVSFRYAGYDIVVHGDGTVQVGASHDG